MNAASSRVIRTIIADAVLDKRCRVGRQRGRVPQLRRDE